VVGAGWAGLAAAVEAVGAGHRVTLLEMAGEAGGRARTVPDDGVHGDLDNGQHILIGAYTDTLALMHRVGVDPEQALLRRPLALVTPDGRGLRLPAGPAVPGFVRAVLRARGWRWSERLALLAAAAGWRLRGFRCEPGLSVAGLTAGLPATLRRELIEPLCVAALNTPAEAASAAVFLRVLRDALFAGPGAADLLLPRERLGELLPRPALAWLRARGAQVHLGTRVAALHRVTDGWRLETSGPPVRGAGFDRVVLATTAVEAARLVEPHDAGWAATARALRHEPIVTVSVQSAGTRLPLPMLALQADDARRPGQFVFDHGALTGRDGVLTVAISGAAAWVERGQDATLAATLAQLQEQLAGLLVGPPVAVKLLTDKRATFRCTPGLARPARTVVPGLQVAGDYVDGPYPATLEGAVRSGLAAARAL
jgi:squalene-associated FAD-dependent desaturase